jgi:hypothetical protein
MVLESAAMSATVVGRSSELSDWRMIARLAQRFDASITVLHIQAQIPTEKKEGLTKDLFDEPGKWFQEASLERRVGRSERKANLVFAAVIPREDISSPARPQQL